MWQWVRRWVIGEAPRRVVIYLPKCITPDDRRAVFADATEFVEGRSAVLLLPDDTDCDVWG